MCPDPVTHGTPVEGTLPAFHRFIPVENFITNQLPVFGLQRPVLTLGHAPLQPGHDALQDEPQHEQGHQASADIDDHRFSEILIASARASASPDSIWMSVVPSSCLSNDSA